MKNIEIRSLLLALLIVGLAAACGCRSHTTGDGLAGSAPSDETSSSSFVDSTVEGLGFSSGSMSGLTGVDGFFEYPKDTEVQFYIGDIMLGSPFVPGTYCTPVNCIPGAMDEFNTEVGNIARLLQSLDDDADAQNGIILPEAVRLAAAGMSLDFTMLAEDFAVDADVLTLLAAIGRTELLPRLDTRRHLGTTLLGMHAGLWRGSIEDGDTGEITLLVNRDHNASGIVHSAEHGTHSVAGHLESDGSLYLSSKGLPYYFHGQFNNGSLEGTYEMNATGGSEGTGPVGTILVGSFSASVEKVAQPHLNEHTIDEYYTEYHAPVTSFGMNGELSLELFSDGTVLLHAPNFVPTLATVTHIEDGIQIVALNFNGLLFRASITEDNDFSGTIEEESSGLIIESFEGSAST